jgi:oligosaccharide repeat unit polymerase
MGDLNAMPAYFLAALFVLALWADVRQDLCRLVSGRNVVLCAMCAWYLLEAIMLPEALCRYSQEQYNVGVFHVGLALTGFLVGYHYTSGCSFFPALGEKITFFDDEKWLWRLVLIGAIIGFAPIVYYTGTQIEELFAGMMGMRASWGGMLARGRYGDARAAFLMLEMFIGGVAPCAAILLFSRASTLVQRLICAIVLGWPILRAYGVGSRSPLISSVGVLIAILYWKATPALRKTMLSTAFFCVPLIYGVMTAIVISRGTGEFSWENRDKGNYVGNEMFRELLFITSKVPAEADYQYGYLYYIQLVNPIPRFLWPGKPTMESGLLMAKMQGAMIGGEAYLTVSPGLIGEMYLNFGVIGIFGLSLFGGWLVKGWDLIPRLFDHSLPTMMFYSGGLGALFIMGRSFTMGIFYGLLAMAGLAWLIRSFNSQAVADANAVSTAPIADHGG